MNPVDILNNHKLKRTSCREGIIEVVMSANHALSENEIKERLAGNYDRSTFYRSFKILIKNNIIHKIVIDNQLIKYALDNSITHNSEHAHFYCNECHAVNCLESTPVHKIKLPEGYSGDKTEILIKGTCAICENQE